MTEVDARKARPDTRLAFSGDNGNSIISHNHGDQQQVNTMERDLSPASRRRLRKRMYMRKKRAEERGETMNEVVQKLRPGRKAKERIKRQRPTKYNKRTALIDPRLLEDESSDEDGGIDIGMILSPQKFHNVPKYQDIFNHSNIHFWEYMLPGFDAM